MSVKQKGRIDELAHLDDYVTGTMPDDEATGFEEELFAAAAKGEAEDARWFERWNLLMGYFGQGDFLVRGTTAEDIEGARRAGMKVHVVEVSHGRTTEYAAPAGIDLVVTNVNCDVRDYDEVEATIENPDGRVLHSFRDCLPDPKTGQLYALCAPALALKAWGGGPRVCRVKGVRRGSADRKIDEIAVFYMKPA